MRMMLSSAEMKNSVANSDSRVRTMVRAQIVRHYGAKIGSMVYTKVQSKTIEEILNSSALSMVADRIYPI